MKDFAHKTKAKKLRRKKKHSQRTIDFSILGIFKSLFRKIFFLCFIILIILSSAYICFVSVLPQFYTLKSDKNILILNQDKTQAYLIHFLHASNMILVESTEDFPEIETTSEIAKAQLSFELSSLVDDYYFFEKDLNLTSLQNLQDFLFDLFLSSKQKGEKIADSLSLYYFSKNSSINFMVEEQGFDDLSSFYLSSYYNDCPIAVLNGTQVSGLGKRYTQVFENSGLQILRLDSSLQEAEQGTIYYDDQKPLCQELVTRINRVLPMRVDQTNQEIINRYRVGIVFVIGSDYVDYVKD